MGNGSLDSASREAPTESS